MSEEIRMITVRAPHGHITHERLVLHGLRCGYCQGNGNMLPTTVDEVLEVLFGSRCGLVCVSSYYMRFTRCRVWCFSIIWKNSSRGVGADPAGAWVRMFPGGVGADPAGAWVLVFGFC